ncbi:MAG: hypothetical protein OEP48_06170 [Betaproteobacteria bacterium]|nr:hypothetical protein [Betaproteobacteria bacterium]MDH3437070.1 hypothetical protein [Betaproteobacteria bacterium]
MTTVTRRFHALTSEELRVIEMAARRAQAEEMLRLVGIAARGTKALFARAATAVAVKIRRTGTTAQHGA